MGLIFGEAGVITSNIEYACAYISAIYGGCFALPRHATIPLQSNFVFA